MRYPQAPLQLIHKQGERVMDNQVAQINSTLTTYWKQIWSFLYPCPGLPSNSATGCLIMHEIGYLIKSNPYTEEDVLSDRLTSLLDYYLELGMIDFIHGAER
jgi:hypothetical protein